MLSADAKSEWDARPKVQVGLVTSPLGINLSHYIYNRLVNLKRIFDIAPDKLKAYDKDVSQVNNAKHDEVLANKKISGYLFKSDASAFFWDNLPTFDAPSEARARRNTTMGPRSSESKRAKDSGVLPAWEQSFCILSGKHLNFYKDQQQQKPFDWFSLNNCTVNESGKQQGLHVIVIQNQKNELRKLKFNSSEQMMKWNAAIRDVVFDDLLDSNNQMNMLATSMRERANTIRKQREQ